MKLSKHLSNIIGEIILWAKKKRLKDFLPDIKILREIITNFRKTIVVLISLLPFIYLGAFHGIDTSHITVGPGGSGYRYLHLQEQFFFNIIITKKAWWEMADNSKDFNSTAFNEGHVTRWRGFGYLWKWEESYDVVYQ